MASIVARSALGILGGILLYVGLCMKVDEEGKPENCLDRLLKQLGEHQNSALNLQAAFLRHVSSWLASRIDTLFWKPGLLVGASVVICATPIALSFMFEPASLWTGPPSIWTKIIFAAVFLHYAGDALDGNTDATFMLVLTCAFPWARRWLGSLGDPVQAFRQQPMFCLELALEGLLLVFAVFFVGAVAVTLDAAVNRSFARWSSSAKNPLIPLSLLLPVNGVLAAIFLAPLATYALIQRALSDLFVKGQFRPEYLPGPKLFFIWKIVGLLGVVTVLPALATALIVGLMLLPHLHRVLWALLQLPLYKVRGTVLKQRWLFITAGIYCILRGFPSSRLIRFIQVLLP